MEPKVGGTFELYGGKIQGKNVELVTFIDGLSYNRIGRKQKNQTRLEI